jgi:hypothetical protein
VTVGAAAASRSRVGLASSARGTLDGGGWSSGRGGGQGGGLSAGRGWCCRVRRGHSVSPISNAKLPQSKVLRRGNLVMVRSRAQPTHPERNRFASKRWAVERPQRRERARGGANPDHVHRHTPLGQRSASTCQLGRLGDAGPSGDHHRHSWLRAHASEPSPTPDGAAVGSAGGGFDARAVQEALAVLARQAEARPARRCGVLAAVAVQSSPAAFARRPTGLDAAWQGGPTDALGDHLCVYGRCGRWCRLLRAGTHPPKLPVAHRPPPRDVLAPFGTDALTVEEHQCVLAH